VTSGHAVVLRSYPEGLPRATDFEFVLDPTPDVGDGQALLRILWASIDPAMRTWHSAKPGRGVVRPLGSVMKAISLAEVVESRNELRTGDFVVGSFGMREWCISDGTDVGRVIDGEVEPRLALGILGHIGLTAYVGLHKVARVRAGETVLVSSAAGATGALAGQIAAATGCRVIGIAGGPDKVAMCLAEYGFDACIDRHAEVELVDAIRTAAPEGIDVYFDNVGGPTLDAAIANMNGLGRVVICGTISVSSSEPGRGPRHERLMLDKQLTIQGFLTSQFSADYPEMLRNLSRLYSEGRIHLREVVVEGLENAPMALEQLLAGQFAGKVLVRITA
jgi:hypothetical protein